MKVTDFFLKNDKDSALYYFIQFNIVFIFLLFLDFPSVTKIITALIIKYPEPHNLLN